MYSYITKELPALLAEQFTALDLSRFVCVFVAYSVFITLFFFVRVSLTGHSMGGHGALTIALKNQSAYKY